MSKIITTDNGQQYQTANGWKTFGAIYAGSIASSADRYFSTCWTCLYEENAKTFTKL